MNYLLHIIIVIGVFLPSVLGYNLVFGRGKILHFGPMGVSIVAAYGNFATLHYTGNYPLSLAVGLLCALTISAVFAWMSLRLEGDAFGILSIATHLALLAVVLNWTSVTRGALGIPQIPRLPGLSTLPMFALAAATIGIGSAFVYAWIDRGPIGRSLAALAENQFHAEALGINRTTVTMKAFLIAGVGAWLGNSLYPQYITLLHPSDYSFRFLVLAIMCVVAGKPGSVWGVTLATTLVMILQECIRFLPLPLSMVGSVRLVFFGVILLGAVYARRETLFPRPRTV